MSRTVVLFLMLVAFPVSGGAEAADPLHAGNMHFVLEQYPEAVAAYREVAESTGEHAAAALFLMGRCQSRMGEYMAAAGSFQQLIERYPDSEWGVRAENGLGDAWSALGEWDRAIEAYRSVVGRRPDSPEAVEARLNIASVEGNPFNGGRDFNAAIENYLYVLRKWGSVGHSDKERAPVYFGIGEAFRNLGRYQEAIAYYERSRGADPSGVWGAAAQNMIGNCRLALDQPEAAAQAYLQTASFHPRQKAFVTMASDRLDLLARQGLRVRADHTGVRRKNGDRVRVLAGDVVVTGEDWEIFCTEAEWDPRGRTLACRGNVRFSRQGVTLLSAPEVKVGVPADQWIVFPPPTPPVRDLLKTDGVLQGMNVPAALME